MFNRYSGVEDGVYNPGTHFKIPWLQTPTIFPTRAVAHTTQSPSGTRDLQMINITMRVLFRPSVDHLPHILRTLGKDFDAKILPSICNETLKAVVAQHTANQLITRREEVSKMVRRNLTMRARDFNIIVDDVSLTHLTFGKEFNQAIEDKQVAQQEAERAKWGVLEAEQNKRGKIIKAQGEAKAAEDIGTAVAQNPAYIELRRLEAAVQIAGIMADSSSKLYLESDSLLLNIQKSGLNDLGPVKQR